MNLQSLGDLAQTFALRRQNVQLKQQMARLSDELASGQTTDLTRHLSGNFGHIADIEHQLKILDSYRISTEDARLSTDAMQRVLEQVQTRTGKLGASAVIAGTTAGTFALTNVSEEGQGNLEILISGLNTNVAGRALFAGTEVDTIPLASADTLLTDVRAAVAGATTAADVVTALDTFFDTPGGAFETSIYQGGTTYLSAYQLGEGEAIGLDLRADDTAIRNALKHTVMAAIVDDGALTLTVDERIKLSREAGEKLLGTQDELTEIRSNLGFAQERIELSSTRTSSEVSGLEMARTNLLSVDMFQTATELENVQVQLETLYTLTARASRLSLVNFLS